MAWFLAFSGWILAQETLEEKKVRADELFENEQYVDATPLYLQILSLEPLILDWNFKYGACLLYNSGQKEKAIRYLNAGVDDPNCDPRAYYFRGRALHLDYQFEAAKKDYNTYLTKRSKKDSRYPVEREIQMCENGKHLLSTFTDIVVMDKQQIGEDKFYDIYHDSKTIGGQIIRNYDFQSKIDKKKGHVPTVHFPPNAKRIFYASYGDDEDTGKDIYMRVKLPNGKWGEPQKVRGGVNTDQDEEYPFLHASGDYLYFSSKGHNSMGGFDVFMSKLDPNTNTFGTAENVDFAISSPNDDLFYVVDSLYQNAYFASARSSENGKLHVYKVKVARVPLQEVIVIGDFSSDLNPDSQKITVQLVKHSNGEDLSKLPVDAAKGGRYSYVFPQGGKYDYIVDVEGSGTQFKFTVELPFLDEFRPLKQEIIHTTENGKEIIRIINRFDESVEGAEAIIAQVIRKKSELNVNVDQFDLKELDVQKEKNELLSQLGYEKMTMGEVSSQLAELQQSVIDNEEITERVGSNISSELIAKSDRIKELDQMENELRENASKINDPIAKHKLLTEASQKQREKETLLKQVNGLKILLTEVEDLSDGNNDSAKIAEIQTEFDALIEVEKEIEALELLTNKKDILDQAKSGSPTGINDSYIQETVDIRKEIRDLNAKSDQYSKSIKNIEAAMNTLERERQGAKRKDQERIDSEMASKRQELQMTQDEIASIKQKVKELELDLNEKEERLASLQNAISTEEKSPTTVAEAKEASEEMVQIESVDPYDYEAELAKLEKDHPEINGEAPIVDWASEIAESHEKAQNEINENSGLSELERTNRKMENNAASIQQIQERIAEIDTQLEKGEDERLTEQRESLQSQKNIFENENTELKAREKELPQETPDAALSKEDVLTEVAPDFESIIAALKSDGSKSERQQLEAILAERNSLDDKIEKELSNIDEELNRNSENEEALARKELLTQLRQENLTQIESVQSELDNLPAEVQPKSSAEVIAEIDSDYEARKEALNSGDMSPIDKEQALLDENKSLLTKIEKSQADLDKKLKKDPENKELLQQKQVLNELKQLLDSEISERQQTINALENSLVESVSPETVISELAPTYEGDLEKIENSDRSPLEKAQESKLLALDVQSTLEKEQKSLSKSANKNPEDKEVSARLNAVDHALENVANDIALLENQMIAIENETPQVATTNELINELQSDYQTQIEEIEKSDVTNYEKSKRRASVELGLLETLKDESNRLDEELDKSPNDAALTQRKSLVDRLIEEKATALEQAKTQAVNAISEIEKQTVINEIAPDYEEITNSAASKEEKIEAETALQDRLRTEIEEKEKQLQRKYSVSVEIEKRILEKLVEDSQERASQIEDSTQPTSESAFIAQVRKESGEVEQALITDLVNLEDLKEQDETLSFYEGVLDTQIADKELEVNENSTEENENELNWLLSEKERVSQKRRSISVSIGELEQSTMASTSEDSETSALSSEEQSLREKLASENLTTQEEKQLKKELAEVEEKILVRENEVLAEDLVEKSKTTKALQESLERDLADSNDGGVTERDVDHAKKEEALIQSQEKQAAEANSEAERNYLLNQAQERRDRLNDDLRDAAAEKKLIELQEEFEIKTVSNESLESKRRKYTIEIGKISRDIQQVDEDLKTAKRKDIPDLESQREELVARKLKLESQLDRVNEQLVANEETPIALNPKALDEDLTFNEERKLASTESYQNYQKAATDALLVANEIRILEDELSDAQRSLQKSVVDGESDEAIRLQAKEIQRIENEIDKKRIDLRQKKYTADQALPENEEEAMKIQNLVARGIQPIKIAAVATTLIQIPTTGFAIDTSSERPNNGSIEIPVDVASPEGLVYRVQVGAFARPLRDDVFKEFNPVSGEKIDGTNITRYMAGYFNSSESVVDARAQIRDLGYSDAFIVAYCNGERVTFGEARRLEAAGICVPKRSEEIVLEVIENTAKKLDLPLTPGEIEEVPELAYNQAPGATEADPIENMEGLFFTVQVGVFNRPISAEEVFNLPNVMTFRLPNGQIRYNTGMFDSAEDAVPRQNFARQSGVQGAFIVAYYKGERISIGNARRLLQTEGNSILQSIKGIKPVEKINTNPGVDSIPTNVVEVIPLEEWELRVQIVTEKTFDEFPRDILNRYNAEGSFYYDSKDKRVKSVIYKNEEFLPNLFNFRDDVDTIYFQEGVLEDEKTEILGLVFTDSLVPGDFMDWLLRCQYRRRVFKSYKGVEVRIFAIPEEKMEQMIKDIRVFGVEPERIIETEEELERDENDE